MPKNIAKPAVPKRKTYEVDEMKTFVKKKSNTAWLVYALERGTGRVADFNIGARTNKTLKSVVKTLQLSEAKRIYTDRLQNYKRLIANKMHKMVVG